MLTVIQFGFIIRYVRFVGMVYFSVSLIAIRIWFKSLVRKMFFSAKLVYICLLKEWRTRDGVQIHFCRGQRDL